MDQTLVSKVQERVNTKPLFTEASVFDANGKTVQRMDVGKSTAQRLGLGLNPQTV